MHVTSKVFSTNPWNEVCGNGFISSLPALCLFSFYECVSTSDLISESEGRRFLLM